ncbi:MAG: ribose 5-phosphate isomerase A [Nitrososphaeria archaeon]|nr:ribose 5-phosphate isomerase A [Nitrososphaeria archaeon]MDW8043827.1 ribose 5-phosphate isomerase A [Nitrososphaerota archaeon]
MRFIRALGGLAALRPATELEREQVAAKAVELVLSMGGEVYLGLGTGSTVEVFGRVLRERGAARVVRAAIPTSRQSEEVARRAGLRVTGLAECPEPDVYVDSFDLVDPKGNSVKGGGAAVAREKVLMRASRRVVLLGDSGKLVERLRGPVPVEALPFAVDYLLRLFNSMGLSPRLREGTGKAGPVVTENGNFVLDLMVGELGDVAAMELEVKSLPGVVEVGLCPNRGYVVLVGKGKEVLELGR